MSLRIALGKPLSFKEPLKTSPHRLGPSILYCAQLQPRVTRLCSSRTVNGSHRFPQLLHQPLKSTVHTSLGARALRPLHRRPASRELRRRRFCVSSCSLQDSLKAALTGRFPMAPSIQLANLARPPPNSCAPPSSAPSRTPSLQLTAPGYFWADVTPPPSPAKPSSRKKRSFHLYPVLALIPYSWQSARKLSVCIRLQSKLYPLSIGSSFFQGMPSHAQKCYLCLELMVLPMS